MILLGSNLHRDGLELAARAVDHLHVRADLFRQAADEVLLLRPQLVFELRQRGLRRRDLLLQHVGGVLGAVGLDPSSSPRRRPSATRLAMRCARPGSLVGVADVEQVDAARRVGAAVKPDRRRHFDVLRRGCRAATRRLPRPAWLVLICSSRMTRSSTVGLSSSC